MAAFLSLVGYQPTAVVAPLAILRSRMQIDQVVLLATRQVKAEAQRLAGWCKDTFSARCEVLDISGGWVDEGTAGAPQTVVEEWARQIGSQQILFNAGPGLNFQVAAAARSLPDSTYFLHPMADSLWSSVWESGQEYWQQWPLVDLGLDSVLKLYGVRQLGNQPSGQASKLFDQLQKLCDPLPQGLMVGLKLKGDSKEVILDLAFESKGYLHGLVSIEGDAVLDSARAVQRITNEFRGLKPRMAVWTDNRAAANRLRRSGHHVICSHKGLRKWVLGETLKPGAHAPVLSEPPMTEEARELLSKQHKGQGGDGPRLVLCLGNDPSTTVLSLTTHRPQRAVICYDSRTPFIVEAAWRLAKLAKNLPVGALEFYPTDHLGRGIRLQVTRLAAGPTVRVDVTPGSKAQACALARTPKVEMWSLASHVGRAFRLIRPEESLPLGEPPLLVQAQARGGDIISPGIAPTPSIQRSYTLLAQFLTKHLAEGGGREILRLFENRKDVIYKWGSMRFYHQGRDRWIKLRVEEHRATLRGIGPDGRWFELLVGCVLQQAGANEVRCQVKWQWPAHWLAEILAIHKRKGTQLRQPPYMDEVDVLARFGHRVVAVSCKAGRNVSWEKAKREIEAVANTTMGRFCLPVLARTCLNDHGREGRKTTRWGAVLIDLRDLADAGTLRGAIDEAFAARATLAN